MVQEINEAESNVLINKQINQMINFINLGNFQVLTLKLWEC